MWLLLCFLQLAGVYVPMLLLPLTAALFCCWWNVSVDAGCPVHCLSLPSLVAEGGDNSTAGCVALVGEALRCGGRGGGIVAGMT